MATSITLLLHLLVELVSSLELFSQLYALYMKRNPISILTNCTFLAVEHNIIVSSSTLSRNLIEAGLTHKKLHKLALKRDEILRDEWKESLRNNYTSEGIELMCLDETSKNDHTYARKFRRAMSGEQAELKDVFVRGDRYSLLPAITTEGYIAMHVVPSSFDSFKFYNFVAEEVVCIAHSHISSIYC
jgi:hypothetical protein